MYGRRRREKILNGRGTIPRVVIPGFFFVSFKNKNLGAAAYLCVVEWKFPEIPKAQQSVVRVLLDGIFPVRSCGSTAVMVEMSQVMEFTQNCGGTAALFGKFQFPEKKGTKMSTDIIRQHEYKKEVVCLGLMLVSGENRDCW